MGLAVGVGLILTGVLVFGVTVAAGPPLRRQVAANLSRGLVRPADGAAPATGRRGLAPIEVLVRRVAPPQSLRRIERLRARAGRPRGWPLTRVVAAKMMLAGAGGAVTLLYVLASPGAGRVLLMAAVVVVAFFTPELLLHSRAQERQEQIALELADTLDQMTIAVEAGLGFDAAVARVARTGTGPLAEELTRTLQDLQVGVSRREAFRALAERNSVTDLQRFVSALLQADAYGISIGSVLRTQAREMRIKRRQRAEEKAMQIPVKVIFPLVLCILPVLFLVLLGPAAVDIMGAFG